MVLSIERRAIGSSIALNHDNSSFGHNNDGNSSNWSVFRWDGNNLNQMGSDIDGEGTNGRLGEGSSAVDLSKGSYCAKLQVLLLISATMVL